MMQFGSETSEVEEEGLYSHFDAKDSSICRKNPNPLPEIQEKLISVQCKLDVLVRGQDNILSSLQSILHADSSVGPLGIPGMRLSVASVQSDSSASFTPTRKPVDSFKEESVATRHQLKLREYVQSRRKGKRVSFRAKTGQMSLPVSPSGNLVDESRSKEDVSPWWGRILETFPLMPQSRISFLLDVVSMAFLFYDSIMVPYMLAWGTKLEGYFLWSSWTVALFWTIDMLLHFCRAFTQDGKIVRETKPIICHYLKRRFVLDLLVISFDWLGIVFEMLEDRDDGSSNNLVLIKCVRLMKVSRLFRLHAMMRTNRYTVIKEYLIQRCELFGLDVQAIFLMMLLKLLVIILWLNHIASCVWIALETSSVFEQSAGRTWQSEIAEMHDGTTFTDAGLSDGFLYFFSYYWALSTMFSGGSFLVPMTTIESIFSSGYTLFGFLVASSMISTMATNLIAGHQATFEKRHKLQKMEQYLQQRNIDPWLSSTISRQLRERLSFQRRVVEKDVQLLTILSADLREKLRIQMWTPVFAQQPLWRTCAHLDNEVINNVIRGATVSFTAETGMTPFCAGDSIKQMFFLLHGSMQYTLHLVRIWEAQDSMVDDDIKDFTHSTSFAKFAGPFGQFDDDANQRTMVFPYQPICEIALWVEWESVGLLEAMEHSELLSVSVEDFAMTLEASMIRVKNVIKGYAKALVGCIGNENPAGLTDLATVDHDSVVPLMSQEDRVNMSLPALTALKKGGHLGQQCYDLHQEVLLGKCNLGQDERGHIVRVVKLVVMRLERDDRCICVNLGDIENQTPIVNVNLPGVKQESGETLGDSVKRILEKCFGSNVPEIYLEDVKTDIEEKPSPAYGIPTKYIRTTCHARVVSSDFAYCTRDFSWAHGIAQCFTRDASVSTSSSRHGTLKERAFAWMVESQYDILVKMGIEAEYLVSMWMHNFMKTLADDDEYQNESMEGDSENSFPRRVSSI